jgi:hypothetical protein
LRSTCTDGFSRSLVRAEQLVEDLANQNLIPKVSANQRGKRRA